MYSFLKNLLFFPLLIIFEAVAFAQYNAPPMSTTSEKAKGFFSQAYKNYNSNSLDAAIINLEKATAEDSMFVEAYQLLADIYHYVKDYKKETETYEVIISRKLHADSKVFYYLGVAQYQQGLYKDARFSLQKALLDGALQNSVRKKTKLELVNVDFALSAVRNPFDYKIVRMSDSINTEYDDYWPSTTADEDLLILTVEIPSPYRDVMGREKGQEDFFESEKVNGQWTKIKNLGEPINTVENEGSQTISFNGQFLFFTACNRRDSKGRCDIYMSEKNAEAWTSAINIGEPVNSSAWESQPCLSPDGRTLYFSSNRPGGVGGKDIWISRLNDYGFWSQPMNLGDSINTQGDENSPFIHYDNQTLYYSTNGLPGLGGQDIVVSRKKKGVWSKPVNMGYPLNTFEDEIGFVVNAAGDKAMYATIRQGSKGRDIYELTVPNVFRPKPVSFVRGVIVDSDTKEELKADFELSDLESASVVTKTNSIDGSGEYVVCLPADQDLGLNISKKGYLFHSQNFKVPEKDVKQPIDLNISLQTIQVGRKEVLRNVFYDVDAYKLDLRSKSELGYLVKFLDVNKNVAVEIGGHTDNQGSDEHNAQLSENRARLVYDYLLKQGVDKSRLTYKGYSSTQPVADNATSEGRAKNRRTEFKITSVKVE